MSFPVPARVALGVALAALAGGALWLLVLRGDEEAAPPSTTTTTTTTTSTTEPEPEPVAPLTGLPGTDPAKLARPALVVKIDNANPAARPQVGLNEADVVYEERVEGSVTRLLAVFHSQDSVPVGPVRSARTSDIAIFSPLNRPYFAWSGANSTFAARVRAAAVHDVGYDAVPNAYFREPTRRAPHNLMLRSTAEILAQPSEGSSPPPPIFTYRAAGEKTAHLEPVTSVGVSYGSAGGAAPVEYRWNGKGWARSQAGTPHVDTAGNQVAPANVIIQFVEYVPTDVGDQRGVPIPEARLVGEGDAWVLTSGGLVQARWSKPSLDAVTTYTDVDGNPVALTPGRTWISLPSPGGATRS